MENKVAITRVQLSNFKAFRQFSISFNEMNILVGPNNSGKSTLLGAFRVLAAGLRRANAKSAEMVPGPDGPTLGYFVPTEDLPISLENAHTDYDTNLTATVVFSLSNGNSITLFFPPAGGAILLPSKRVKTPSSFVREFPIKVEAVPVLGPLEHKEDIVEKRTVQRGLITHRASRHFRNYWYQFQERFTEFATLIQTTWPGMDITAPELLDYEYLVMFCREGRIERELYWSGFGFQVWCQLLTHIVRSQEANILIIDEPEIYLHPDLQRRLLVLLRNAGPDVILATHSTEILSEAEPSEVVLIDKTRRSGQRIKDSDQVQSAIDVLGSSRNVTLTQLARTQRVLLVEGSDFKILSRFAQQLGLSDLASKFDFTVIPVGGFSAWPDIKVLRRGMELTLGKSLLLGAVFDRDFRCDEEIQQITEELSQHTTFVTFHKRKEIENYLLVPQALDRAIRSRLADRSRRQGTAPEIARPANELLEELTIDSREDVLARYTACRIEHFKHSPIHNTTVITDAGRLFNEKWKDVGSRMEIVPGKEVFSALNKFLGDTYHITLTPTNVIASFHKEDIPYDIVTLLRYIDKFRKMNV